MSEERFQQLCSRIEDLVDKLLKLVSNPSIVADEERLVALAYLQSVGGFLVKLGDAMESSAPSRMDELLNVAEGFVLEGQRIVDKHPVVKARG